MGYFFNINMATNRHLSIGGADYLLTPPCYAHKMPTHLDMLNRTHTTDRAGRFWRTDSTLAMTHHAVSTLPHQLQAVKLPQPVALRDTTATNWTDAVTRRIDTTSDARYRDAH